MVDGSQREFGLLPEGADQARPTLHGLQAPAGERADFGKTGWAQVGDFMFLEVGPDRLDRIEFGCVGWQERDGDLPVLLFQPLANASTLVGADAVPHDQQLAANLALERSQELDDLLAFDRTIEEAEVEAPPGQPGDRRHLLPGEALLDDRRATLEAPSARHRALLRQPGLVDEDYRPSLATGLFFSAG